MAERPAVFLDRDGTIIEDVGYLSDPEEVKLLPGAAAAIGRFAQAGYAVVVVSNQSGIARGLFDERQLNRVHARMEKLLSHYGAKLDGVYYCPYLDGPEATIEAFRCDSDLRKPHPGMILQAGKELDIDLASSWMIGDALRDMEAGRQAGCRTVLLGRGRGRGTENGCADFTADSLAQAADIVERERTAKDKTETQHPLDWRPTDRDSASEIESLLERILMQIESINRSERQQDFSVLRLLGSLLQMFAIVAALWGGLSLLDEAGGGATAKLVLACFLQIASLSAFAIDRFR